MRIQIIQTATEGVSEYVTPAGVLTDARPCVLVLDGTLWTSATPRGAGEAATINRDAEKLRDAVNDAPPAPVGLAKLKETIRDQYPPRLKFGSTHA